MKKITSVYLEKVINGWLVTENYRTEDNTKEWDCEEEKFIFPTIDEAFVKIKELFA